MQTHDEILEEELDENYEPTEQEIANYATYLGFQMPQDNHLLYIAKEGLKAPIPSDWKPCRKSTGQIYYFNFTTGESKWEHPCDEYYKKLFQTVKTREAEKDQQDVANELLMKEFYERKERYLRSKENELLNTRNIERRKREMNEYSLKMKRQFEIDKEIIIMERQARLLKYKQQREKEMKEYFEKEKSSFKSQWVKQGREVKLKLLTSSQNKSMEEMKKKINEEMIMLKKKLLLLQNKVTITNNQMLNMKEMYAKKLEEYSERAASKMSTNELATQAFSPIQSNKQSICSSNTDTNEKLMKLYEEAKEIRNKELLHSYEQKKQAEYNEACKAIMKQITLIDEILQQLVAIENAKNYSKATKSTIESIAQRIDLIKVKCLSCKNKKYIHEITEDKTNVIGLLELRLTRLTKKCDILKAKFVKNEKYQEEYYRNLKNYIAKQKEKLYDLLLRCNKSEKCTILVYKSLHSERIDGLKSARGADTDRKILSLEDEWEENKREYALYKSKWKILINLEKSIAEFEKLMKMGINNLTLLQYRKNISILQKQYEEKENKCSECVECIHLRKASDVYIPYKYKHGYESKLLGCNSQHYLLHKQYICSKKQINNLFGSSGDILGSISSQINNMAHV